MEKKTKVSPRLELGLWDSKSQVLTIAPQDRKEVREHFVHGWKAVRMLLYDPCVR